MQSRVYILCGIKCIASVFTITMYFLTYIILKKSVESTTYYSTTYYSTTGGGAYCTESKAFFTFLKLTHRVTWLASRKWIVSK